MPLLKPEKLLNWSRFWCPRNVTYRLGNNGFLSDPVGEHGHILNPGLVRLSDVREPVVVLLGEPGMGKTSAVAQECDRIATSGEAVLAIDLLGAHTENSLRNKLSNCDTWKQWLAESYCLHLYLDAFDEGIGLNPSLPELLLQHLEGADMSRLRIRFVCRTGEWPEDVSKGLGELCLGTTQVSFLEIVPLRKCDVRLGAADANLNADEFLDAVEDRQVQALANRPITLRLLLQVYATSKALPTSQLQLYEQGCERLCSETNSRRLRTQKTQSILDARQRLSLASRIAAVMTLTTCPPMSPSFFLRGATSVVTFTLPAKRPRLIPSPPTTSDAHSEPGATVVACCRPASRFSLATATLVWWNGSTVLWMRLRSVRISQECSTRWTCPTSKLRSSRPPPSPAEKGIKRG